MIILFENVMTIDAADTYYIPSQVLISKHLLQVKLDAMWYKCDICTTGFKSMIKWKKYKLELVISVTYVLPGSNLWLTLRNLQF